MAIFYSQNRENLKIMHQIQKKSKNNVLEEQINWVDFKYNQKHLQNQKIFLLVPPIQKYLILSVLSSHNHL